MHERHKRRTHCLTTTDRCTWLIGTLAIFLVACSARTQTLRQVWVRNFDKPVSWYVRTPAGILLIRSGTSLSAVDDLDGRQLWSIPDLKFPAGNLDFPPSRSFNVLEVPLMGVVLVNDAQLPGDSGRHLIGLNLMTGQRLWELPRVEPLATVVSLYNSRGIVVVSRRRQKKIMAFSENQVFAFRFEFTCLDAVTGKLRWTSEYPRTFLPGRGSFSVSGNRLLLNYSDHVLASINTETGKVEWERKSEKVGTPSVPVSASYSGKPLM